MFIISSKVYNYFMFFCDCLIFRTQFVFVSKCLTCFEKSYCVKAQNLWNIAYLGGTKYYIGS